MGPMKHAVLFQTVGQLDLGKATRAASESALQTIRKEIRKTSYATCQTNPGHAHKAPDHSYEVAQPMVDLCVDNLRSDATDR